MSSLQTQSCPHCGAITDQLVSIDAGMRVALSEAGLGSSLPEEVCSSCYEGFAGQVSQGLKLRMERDHREKNKAVMWKNRVQLVKNARALMAQKAYTEAAIQYEKYIRILELVYNLEKGQINPKVFNNSARSKEMTVIASVFWDLLRIYDTSPHYSDRMSDAAQKLSEFLPYSQIYPDVVKQADHFARSAKNPTIVREFLKTTKSQRGPCFIASAAFADQPYALELYWLRRFRDEVLRPWPTGRRLIWLYYKFSPRLARDISQSPAKTFMARWFITKMTLCLKKILKSA